MREIRTISLNIASFLFIQKVTWKYNEELVLLFWNAYVNIEDVYFESERFVLFSCKDNDNVYIYTSANNIFVKYLYINISYTSNSNVRTVNMMMRYTYSLAHTPTFY